MLRIVDHFQHGCRKHSNMPADRFLVSRHLVALPSAEELRRFLETDRTRMEAVIERITRAGAEKPAPKLKSKKPSPRR